MDIKKELIITIFGGMFGIHKFMNGETKKGFLYLFTVGLFGLGWAFDVTKLVIKYLQQKIDITNNETYSTNGQLPAIQGTCLNLAPGETCCYMESGYTFKDKIVTTGYTGKRNGVSIRIAKGLSYHTGGNGNKAIRENQRTTYPGVLYLTSKRVIYTSQDCSFDKPIDKITLIQEAKDGLIIQLGSNTYSIVIKSHAKFMAMFNLTKQQLSLENN